MNKILVLLFTLFLTSNFYSQSYIDVIRSSSYYSTAVINFTEGDYKSAMYNLQLAEKNLKGNTNRDLEFLKIMSNYNLSNYKLAYDLTKSYFDVGFSERKKSFRNVTSYSKTNNIHYEEVLTALFVSLEEKSKLKKNPDSDNSIAKIVTRILSNKVTFTNYTNAALLSKVTEKIDYCLREFSNGSLKRVYENNFLNLKMSSPNEKYSINYTGTISGKSINTSNYKINVSFTPTKAELNNGYYRYGYKQNAVKYLEGKITLKETAYQCYSLTAPKYKRDHFSNFLIKKLQQKNFTKKGYKTKAYQILFTEKEKAFLKQDNNLTKLHVALKNKGLL